MAKFTASMYETLKASMKEQRSGGSFKDILKTEIGKSYLVRLIPNVADIKKTSFHYYNHGWKSLATGQFISSLCPTTFGDRCPICEERIRLYRGDAEDKENAKLLGRKEQWLINAYVIEDETNKENNGTIKVLRYGKQLDSVINEATEGADAKEFGMRIYDLSENGCNMRIRVEKNQGGYPDYNKSKFLRESAIPGMTEELADKTYSKILDLGSIFERKTPEQVNDMMMAHFYCKSTSESISGGSPDVSEGTSVSVSETPKAVTPAASPAVATSSDSDVDAKLKDLMKDL